ncbi:MAG: biotin-dependent carboxyltransferase family protein [Alphaproteobacteria bacterium]
MGALKIEVAGPSSTLQDAGRFGFQRFGVSVAGASDPLLLAAANALVGNSPFEGALEFTLTGDTLVVEAASCHVAVTGDAVLTIDGDPAQAWRSYRLKAGQVLRVGALRSGVRGYLAVAGGFAVDPVLGSVSTHVRSALGGLHGRALRAGDRLPLRLNEAPERMEGVLDTAELPRPGEETRVVLGPQDDLFTPAGVEALLSGTYRVSHEADRMGYRLEGPKIDHAAGFNITSDGIPPGAIQVPGTGQPIVLLADRQTTGGYPKIGCVIAPDLGPLAQKRPGDPVRFRAVTPGQARVAYSRFHTALAALPGLVRAAGAFALHDSERLLSINLVGGMVDGLTPDRGLD